MSDTPIEELRAELKRVKQLIALEETTLQKESFREALRTQLIHDGLKAMNEIDDLRAQVEQLKADKARLENQITYLRASLSKAIDAAMEESQ